MPFGKGNQEAKKGKPAKMFADALRIAVSEAADNGQQKIRLLADKLVEEALAGNVQALSAIADRLDGKPAQQLNLGDNEGGPLSIAIVRYSDANQAS